MGLIISFRAGVLPGDIITKINGNKIVSNKEVYRHVNRGETFEVEVKRGDKHLKFTLDPEVVG